MSASKAVVWCGATINHAPHAWAKPAEFTHPIPCYCCGIEPTQQMEDARAAFDAARDALREAARVEHHRLAAEMNARGTAPLR